MEFAFLLPPDSSPISGGLGVVEWEEYDLREGQMQVFEDAHRWLVVSSWARVSGRHDGLAALFDRDRGEHPWPRGEKVHTRRLLPSGENGIRTSCVWWTVGHDGTRGRTGVEFVGVGYSEAELVDHVPEVVIDAPGSASLRNVDGMRLLYDGGLPIGVSRGPAWSLSTVTSSGAVVVFACLTFPDAFTRATAAASEWQHLEDGIFVETNISERHRRQGITCAAVKPLTADCGLQAVGYHCEAAELIASVRSLRAVDQATWERCVT